MWLAVEIVGSDRLWLRRELSPGVRRIVTELGDLFEAGSRVKAKASDSQASHRFDFPARSVDPQRFGFGILNHSQAQTKPLRIKQTDKLTRWEYSQVGAN